MPPASPVCPELAWILPEATGSLESPGKGATVDRVKPPMSQATTRGIRVTVTPSYEPRRSDPSSSRFFFSYHVRIENGGADNVQLLSRHWVITDARGAVENVRGPGVVGHQPRLGPGQAFEYDSFCPLHTPVGTMHGTYTLVTEAGETFEAEIPLFHLAAPTPVN